MHIAPTIKLGMCGRSLRFDGRLVIGLVGFLTLIAVLALLQLIIPAKESRTTAAPAPADSFDARFFAFFDVSSAFQSGSLTTDSLMMRGRLIGPMRKIISAPPEPAPETRPVRDLRPVRQSGAARETTPQGESGIGIVQAPDKRQGPRTLRPPAQHDHAFSGSSRSRGFWPRSR
jgi:hypothetical protein